MYKFLLKFIKTFNHIMTFFNDFLKNVKNDKKKLFSI